MAGSNRNQLAAVLTELEKGIEDCSETYVL